MSGDSIKYREKQPTEKEKIVHELHRMTIRVYTADEIQKLRRAYEEKYNISPCDGLPCKIEPIRVFTGIQIVDLEKLK